MTVEGEARQHTEQGRERKRQLMDAAVTLFSERGYEATRISDICDAAGVAKGLFYWYFPTKRDLFLELVRTMRRALREAQAAAMDRDADPLSRIRQGTEASVRFMAEHAAYFSLVEMEGAGFRGDGNVYLADVRSLVVAGQEDGTITAADPQLLAYGIVTAVSTFSTAWRNRRLDVDTDELAVFVGGWVVQALSGAPAAEHEPS